MPNDGDVAIHHRNMQGILRPQFDAITVAPATFKTKTAFDLLLNMKINGHCTRINK
jgi:hypothetical protein